MLVLVSLCRVPQIMERLLPFSVLIGAMTCFFSLSRRMELVVARGAGISEWQIIAPALVVALGLGAFGTLVYNPVSANLREFSKCRVILQRPIVCQSYLWRLETTYQRLTIATQHDLMASIGTDN
jgi:hypothetical protein